MLFINALSRTSALNVNLAIPLSNGISDVAELANEGDPTRFQIEINVDEKMRPSEIGYMVATQIKIEYDIQTQRIRVKSLKAYDCSDAEFNLIESDIGSGGELTQSADNYRVKYPKGWVVELKFLDDFVKSLVNSRYFPAFRNAINEGAGSYYDLPVGTALIGAWDSWKAGSIRANKIAISKVEAEIASLLGFESLQINADQSGKSLDVIIDGRPQKLHEVGAGIAQLIIVLAAALIHKPPYILIDEPELSLHPSLQLNFLLSLGSYAQNGLIYATHSISLARSSAKRIYAVKKIRNGVSQMHPFGDESINFGGWLGELSYSSRVDLGCDGILLVEGTTDILCFQELLRKIGKDQKYVLISLGGGLADKWWKQQAPCRTVQNCPSIQDSRFYR